jgi:cytochrome c-type biogenesis protein CcmH
MMILFYLMLAAMTLVAAGFLFLPQLRRRNWSKSGIGLSILLLILLMTVAGGMYRQLGASKQLAELNKLEKLDQIIVQLKRHLESNPDGHGWYLLGRLYLNKQQLQAALVAFTKANQLSPNKPEIVFAYAQTLNWLAMDSFQHQNYQQAIDYWQRLLLQLDAKTPAAKAVFSLIAEAQQKLN